MHHAEADIRADHTGEDQGNLREIQRLRDRAPCCGCRVVFGVRPFQACGHAKISGIKQPQAKDSAESESAPRQRASETDSGDGLSS